MGAFVIYVSPESLLYYLVCSLQPCGYLLEKGFALLCVMFPCVFVTFPYGGLGQVWFLIVSIPDLCLLYFYRFYGNKNSNQNRLNIVE